MGASTRAAGNTAAQEKFIGGLNTSGALDDGSGFERKFGAKETNQQYSDRLDLWKNKGKTPTVPSAAPVAAPMKAPAAQPSRVMSDPGITGGNMPPPGAVGGSSSTTGVLGGLGTMTPTSATAAVEGLQGAGGAAAMSQPGVAMSGGGGPVELPGVGSLRQGLGQRMYPEMNSALAGLKRIY